MSSLYAKYKDLGDKEPKFNQTGASLCQECSTIEQKMDIIKNNKVVCIDIHADWCGPCKQIEPQFNELAQKYAGKCAFVKENVDLKLSKNIRGVPTFVFFKNGYYIDSITGADLYGEEGVESKIKELISQGEDGMKL